ncbi:MAG: ABC transporter ATP-binding protein [Candidatus Aminicenantes bacterium]|nr:MAG: ABC transporter ATP-binding protein [Candidatus Aminicenantes bacterium]
MAILEVDKLSAGYENGDVIQDISFSLNKSEFISVLGKNGSGKSTLIKALQGLLKNVSGRILVDGEDVFSLSPRQLAKKISYVPQIFSSSFEFSVAETVLMGRYAHQGRLGGSSPDDTRITEEIMSLTKISHLKEKKVAHLSGGERQRVFIARALAQDTPLLFLDEPSSHLDIRYQVEIYQILKQLQEEKGKTILTTEHNINLAIPFSQQIMFLKDGRVQALGPPENLITKQNILEVFEAAVEIRENIHSRLPEISLIPKPDQKE